MGVDTEGFALFVHIALVVAGLMMAAVLHAALLQLRRAPTFADMRPWVPVIRRVEPLLPLAALGVFASGAWLIELSDGAWAWDQGWILTSIVGLVVGEAVGAALAPYSHALTAAIADAGDGTVSPEVRQRSLDARLWCGSHFITAVFFGIIFLMSAKPNGVWGPIGIIVASGLFGIASAVPFLRPAHAHGERQAYRRPAHP
jgi:hypothetical protein